MNYLDKKDLLELANIIKSSANNIGSVTNNNSIILDDIEEIIGCVDAIIEIVENKPHKIEKMF
jgi:hypothetical protein